MSSEGSSRGDAHGFFAPRSPPDHFEGILAEELCNDDRQMVLMMRAVENPVHPPVETLSHAVGIWVERRDGRELTRWLTRELDADGVPARLAVPDWHRCLEILAAARKDAGDWPPGCEERIGA